MQSLLMEGGFARTDTAHVHFKLTAPPCPVPSSGANLHLYSPSQITDTFRTACQMKSSSASTLSRYLKAKANSANPAKFSHERIQRPLILPEPISFLAADGYCLHGMYWGQDEACSIGAVLINGATGMKCSYYANYAQYLSSLGFNVLTFDYRGIGLSRPEDIRKLNVTKRD